VSEPDPDIRLLERILDLQHESSDVGEQIFQMVRERVRHQQQRELDQDQHQFRLDRAWLKFRIFMAILGFAVIGIFSLVAIRLIDAGATTQAGISLGAGAVSAAAIFVTGRAAAVPLFLRRRSGQPDDSPGD
jgi:hypothetical protein